MSQVSQPKSADDFLMNIAAANQPSTPTQSSEPTPVAKEPEVNNVEVSNTEPTTTKSDGTGVEDKEPKLVPDTPVNLIDDWDASPSEPVTTTQATVPSYDFSSLGKTIGIEAKSDQDIVTEFKKLREQNELLTKSSTESKDLFANDVLLKANEIAKNNGDYLGFLGIASIDFDAVPDRDLVEDELLSYYEPTPENQQKIESYLDGLDETSLEIRGAEIRNKRKHEQASEKNRFMQESESNRLKAQNEKILMDKKVADEIASIKDISGFVLKPEHKQSIFEDITSGKLYDKLFFTDGKFDPKKAVEAAFIVEHHKNMVQYYKTRAKVDGKREVIASITNAELDRQSSVVSGGEQKSAMDSYIDSLKQGK